MHSVLLGVVFGSSMLEGAVKNVGGEAPDAEAKARRGIVVEGDERFLERWGVFLGRY